MTVHDAYIRKATVVRVIDGDTALCDVDLGFYVTVRYSVRLYGINARELHDPGGPDARDHLAAILPPGTAVTITSVKADKYAGRVDAVLYLGARSINDRLVREGWAAPYDGSGLTSDHVPTWPREEVS